MTQAEIHLYVDGSYNKDHNIAAGAVVAIDPANLRNLYQESKIVTTEGVQDTAKRDLIAESLTGHNIAGEIEGVKLALKFALNKVTNMLPFITTMKDFNTGQRALGKQKRLTPKLTPKQSKPLASQSRLILSRSKATRATPTMNT